MVCVLYATFSCRCVIEPYNRHPILLEVLLNLLKTEQVQNIRREVSKWAADMVYKKTSCLECVISTGKQLRHNVFTLVTFLGIAVFEICWCLIIQIV